MNRCRQLLQALPVAACAIGVGLPAQAEDVQSWSDLVTEGTVELDFRYRFEFVDQEGFDRDAEASTLRSRLGLSSASWKGLRFKVEFDDVTAVGDDDYNSTENGEVAYPVVADPEGTEVNQAWLEYSWQDLVGRYGRQRILQGNQRFVGNVGWRQNEQTYDGLRVQWQGGPGLSLDYAYVYGVNRVFGPDDGPVQPADFEGDNHLLRASWQPAAGHTLSGFAYLVDIEEERGYPPARSVDNSSDTYGIEYQGDIGPFAVQASYATQSDGGDSQLDYDADYYLLQADMALKRVTFQLGYEVLEGDNGVGFKTPYATLHKFQGWADQFLVTPGDGVEDAYLGVSGALGPVKLAAWYHDFQAQDSGADFGRELDLVATWPVSESLELQLKYAGFDADDRRYSDVDKAWLTVHLKL